MLRKLSFYSLILLTGTNLCHAESPAPKQPVTISVAQWQAKGTFDYYLHYDSGQLESWVSAPQQQSITMWEITKPLSEQEFLKLTYGTSGLNDKGEGADTDWQDGTPGAPWYYGNIDFHGKQQILNVDYGRVISQDKQQKTSAYLGWNSHKTTNELKNVVYHTIAYANVGNQTQPDNGSTLRGTFEGFHVGVERDQHVGNQLKLNATFTLSYLNAAARGHWNNHTPAWVWDNKGAAVGQEFSFGANYQLRPDLSATVGYRYYYVKMVGGDEVLDTGGPGKVFLNDVIDLGYKQQGIYYSINAKF